MMRNPRLRTRATLAAALALAGCAGTAPPDPLMPAAVPAHWTSDAGVVSSEGVIPDDWWTSIGDSALSQIIAAAGDTADVRIARARLDEANAYLRGAEGALRPHVTLDTTAGLSKPGDAPQAQSFAAVQARLSWDIDLFGANRARLAAALSARDAAVFRLSAARISARAAAARLYFTYREAERRHNIAEETIMSLGEMLALARSREAAGLSTALDVAQAEAALALARGSAPRYLGAGIAAARGLEALLGMAPGSLTAVLKAVAGAEVMVHEPAVSSPADAIARRPDIAAADKLLAAAGYDVTAARRDFYPTLRLGAASGLQAVSPVTPFQDSGVVGSVMAGLTIPLLERGTLAAARDAASARQRAAAEIHRQTVMEALGQIETAGNAFRSAQSSAGHAAQAAAAGERQLQLAGSRYRAGISSFLEVITAEQAVFAAREGLATAEGDAARALAALYAAMGFGSGAVQ